MKDPNYVVSVQINLTAEQVYEIWKVLKLLMWFICVSIGGVVVLSPVIPSSNNQLLIQPETERN